ncbi:MAG: GHMP kinase [Clostridia bacterium]|nr:GHMP kinase [Clostridia bacterium]
MRCEEVYFETYGKAPEYMAFCPYRISPLGAHIDHQYGKINGLAIDQGIHIAYSPKHNGVVELKSLNFSKRAQFPVMSIPDKKVGDWADHLRGAAQQLGAKYPLRTGISAVIEGTLPIGGLSSSAAVIIAFLSALARVNGIRLGDWETILMAKAAENSYVGVNCGKLDQSCEVLCRKDQLLYLDCQDDSYSLIPKPDNMKPFDICVFFSGLERSLQNSQYNLRQDECKAAAYSLLAYAGLPYGKFQETRLRDVPHAVYERYGDRLPENFRKRARHFFTEFHRAEEGAEAWRKGDLDTYGRLVFESGLSSIENYECGCPELITLYHIMRETDGIYGGRFSGAGFKGCCMALVDPEKSEDVCRKVEEAYLKVYPELKGKYVGCICHSSDGVVLNV